MGFIAIDSVGWQGALAPCVGTTHAMHAEVDIEIDETTTGNLIGMRCFEIFLAIVPCTDAEGLETDKV